MFSSMQAHYTRPLFLTLEQIIFFFLHSFSYYVAQGGLKGSIPLPQLPKCWDFRKGGAFHNRNKSKLFSTVDWVKNSPQDRGKWLILVRS